MPDSGPEAAGLEVHPDLVQIHLHPCHAVAPEGIGPGLPWIKLFPAHEMMVGHLGPGGRMENAALLPVARTKQTREVAQRALLLQNDPLRPFIPVLPFFTYAQATAQDPEGSGLLFPDGCIVE